MDWLEEKTEQFRDYLKNASLTKSLLAYLLAALIGVLAGTLFTRNLCLGWVSVILERFPEAGIYSRGLFLYTPEQSGDFLPSLKILLFFYNYGLYLYTLAAFIIIGNLFFENKMKPALHAVTESVSRIAAGDLSHEIAYHSGDEMGQMCAQFESMRERLILEKQKQWSMQEEQRKINAAFAHDIRTPLTVIKGYTEFLQKYIPRGKVSQEQQLEKLDTMLYQENRLLEFAKTMTTIQNIEKRDIRCRRTSCREVSARIDAVINVIQQNTDKQIMLTPDNTLKEIYADSEIILEVIENILNNALRYASATIEMLCKQKNNEFQIFIKDDGPGFSDKALREAANLYFSEAVNSDTHFGLGLAITQILSEKHGGSLTLQNSISGGAITAVSFHTGRK